MSKNPKRSWLNACGMLSILGWSVVSLGVGNSKIWAQEKPPLVEWKPFRENSNSRPPPLLKFIDPNKPDQRGRQPDPHKIRQVAGEGSLPTPTKMLPKIPEPMPTESIEAMPLLIQPSPLDDGLPSTPMEDLPADLGETQGDHFHEPEFGYRDSLPSARRNMDDNGYLGFYWAKAEYLYLSMDGSHVPVLASTSPVGTARANAGVLGLPTTNRLFGGDTILDEARSGLKLELGIRLDQCGENALAISYYGLDSTTDGFSGSQASFPILARPFFSVEPGNVGPNAELVAFPGVLSGNLSVDASSEFQGGEITFHHALENGGGRRLKVLLGYRYNSLNDQISISDEKRVLDGSSGLAIGTTLSEFDRFGTENRFHGANLGVMAEARYQRLTIEMLMKLGIGQTNAEATLSGQTTSTVPLGGGGSNVSVTPSGLLVQSSNAGHYEASEFAMIPELGIILGCNLTRHLKATAGYNLIYWSRVARASEQIDPLVNLSQLAPAGLNGLARPEFDWSWNDFMAHGLSAGLDFRY